MRVWLGQLQGVRAGCGKGARFEGIVMAGS